VFTFGSLPATPVAGGRGAALSTRGPFIHVVRIFGRADGHVAHLGVGSSFVLNNRVHRVLATTQMTQMTCSLTPTTLSPSTQITERT
jgi:hypothetical protein